MWLWKMWAPERGESFLSPQTSELFIEEKQHVRLAEGEGGKKLGTQQTQGISLVKSIELGETVDV